jgi:mono/diheme cytochrome c family protein
MAALLSVVLVMACNAMPEPTAVPTSVVPTPRPAEPTVVPPTLPPVEPTTVAPTQPPVSLVVFPSEMPSAVRGEPVFEANCMGCHGAAGDGSGLAGAANFTELEFMRGKTPAEFFRAIRDGIEDTAMPAFGGQLDETDIWDAVYAVWTFSTSPQEVAQGGELYAAVCAGCHGRGGDGSGPGCTGPSCHDPADFTDQAFMSNRNPQGFHQAIHDGIEGTAMDAWGDRFNDDEVWSLINSIWTFAYEYLERQPVPTPTAPQPTPSPTPPPAVQPTASPRGTPMAPTDTPRLAATPQSTATPTPSLPAVPDPTVGQQLWSQKPCNLCHGASAQGDSGPRLAGTGLSFDQVLLTVRTGAPPMPSFDQDQVSNLELQHIHAWLRSLAPPTPTPIAAPAFPTGALMAMWQHVNDMKVKCDFAKDLPERLAADDAGRLVILKQHGIEAVQMGQAAIAQANQAMAEIPNESVRATIRRVIDETNAVIANANAALAQGSFSSAWPYAAEMVRISRLDAWPLATQAVRDAGLVGRVRVRVNNQAGSPIAGAFVTVLTAHTPVGVRADGSGRVTLMNVAAVPALQVKAYAAGLVYHEVHVNLSPGTTADASIALPGPSVGGQTPWVANAAIEPSAGPGNATVTFRVTAGDPQGVPNLAEDQVFALNPDLGVAYIMRHAGGNQHATQVALPDLPPGLHTWHFFAVDHQCNTSGVLLAQYRAQ